MGGTTKGLADFEQTMLPLPDGGNLLVTALPAQHGPDEIAASTGQVIGFLLSGAGLPSIYISGDNWSLDIGRMIAERIAPVDVAIMYGGGARFAELLDGAEITMPKEDSVKVAKMLSARQIIPAHTEGWAHFKEGYQEFRTAFYDGGLGQAFIDAAFGERIVLRI
ncbi:hypothetical protein GCM10027033_27110 [Leucobacter ruminantium]